MLAVKKTRAVTYKTCKGGGDKGDNWGQGADAAPGPLQKWLLYKTVCACLEPRGDMLGDAPVDFPKPACVLNLLCDVWLSIKQTEPAHPLGPSTRYHFCKQHVDSVYQGKGWPGLLDTP